MIFMFFLFKDYKVICLGLGTMWLTSKGLRLKKRATENRIYKVKKKRSKKEIERQGRRKKHK